MPQNITRGSSKNTTISLVKSAMPVSHLTHLGVLQWQHWGIWNLILVQNWCQLWPSDSYHMPVLRLLFLLHNTAPTETSGSMHAGTHPCMCTWSWTTNTQNIPIILKYSLMPGVEVYTHETSIQVTEAVGAWVSGQPGLLTKAFSRNNSFLIIAINPLICNCSNVDDPVMTTKYTKKNLTEIHSYR